MYVYLVLVFYFTSNIYKYTKSATSEEQ